MADRRRDDPTRARAWPDRQAEDSDGLMGFVRRNRHGVALAVYALFTATTLLTSYGLRFDLAVPEEYVDVLGMHLAVLVVLRMATAWITGLTRVPWRYVGPGDMVRLLAAGLGATLVFAVVFRGPVGLPNVPWSVILIEAALFVLAVGGTWLVYRHFNELSRIRKKPAVERRRPPRRVVVVGAGQTGVELVRELLRMPREFQVLGFLDDSPELRGARLHGVPVLGAIDEAGDLLPPLEVNEVAIALPSPTPPTLRRIVTALDDSRVPVKVLSGGPSMDGGATRSALRQLRIEDLLGRDPVTLTLPELSRDLDDATVLITGAAGSIGSELARQVAANHPARLVLVDQAESDLYWIDLELRRRWPALTVDAVVADILDVDRMDELFERLRPDRVYHAAAYKHVPLMEHNPSEALRNNVLGTWEIARRAGRYGAGRFVLVSTDKAADPVGVMGATKRAAELAVEELQAAHPDTHYTAVRFGNVLGSNGSVLPLFQKQLEAGGPITITDPEVTRYFMTIPEAVQLVLQAGLLPEARGRIAMLDMGEPVKIVDLARNMVRLAGLRPDEDIEFVTIGLRPGEKLHETLQGEDEARAPTSLASVFLLSSDAGSGPGMTSMVELVRRGVSDAEARTILASIATLEGVEAVVPAPGVTA